MYLYHRRSYEVSQLILDTIAFWPIWSISARLRVALDPFTVRQLTAEQAHGWVPPLGLILVLSLALWLRLKLFVVPQDVNAWSVAAWAAENSLIICSVTVLTTFFSREFGGGASRIFVLCLIPVAFTVLTATRCLLLGAITLLQRGSRLPRTALVGDWSSAKSLVFQMESRVKDTVRGVILPEGTVWPGQTEMLPVLGTTSQVAELVNRERLERVIVINGSLPDSELAQCNKVFFRMGLPVTSTLSLAVAPAVANNPWSSSSRIELSERDGLPVVDVQPRGFARAQNLCKWILDVVASVALLVLLFPAMLVIGILVKLQSKGPVFEKAPRVGLGGRHFICLKFRTTYEDLNLPAPPQYWTSPDAFAHEQHHVTALGKFLRRYSLDELPQLINILRGEMSLVGPRPLPAHSFGPDGMSKAFGTWSEARSRVQPGLTGLWQVEGRNALSFEEMIRLDLQYSQNASLWLDLLILLKTPLAVVRAVGAS
jgi:lipopolysaccharide/colanic/teichoic acid biosynthesis glycosyltransferase